MLNAVKRLSRHLTIDVSPLRDSRDYRLLFTAGVITMFGSFITLVAVPYQMKQLTDSYLAVGLVSLAEFVPMVVCGLWGGAIADALDRRKIIVVSELGLLFTTATLMVNAMLPDPQVWVLYVVGAVSTGIACLQRPSLEAVIQQVVKHDQQSAAAVLSSLRWNFGAIVAPALGGLLVTTWGPAGAYALDSLTFAVSLVLLWRVGSLPPAEDAAPASLKSLVEGVRYAMGRSDLIGTYVVDIAAMVFAMSTALYPWLADELRSPQALGLLYSASAVGALIASVTGRWTARVQRQGLGVIVSAALTGAAVALTALAPNVWLVFVCLALAGAADMVSGIFRMTMWNQTIPPELRGRLAGIELLSYASGPMLGNARASLMAKLSGTRFSLGAGGLLCVGAVLALAATLPRFRRYDARTDEHALSEKARRETAAA
ncbi:Predicted arabinose efflux permease, MFS family [Nonomuraea solani]|uniref:Predicted arabinose efflux permease, MFS family n=1 Tax=Nonomuraea solani TaxID=1144553 RepID=A0A1H6E0R6_9ACTN|nr:MFS transporter [Nonomuraea solani]SEG90586.1 Predicted arabinose efflux permease, MFS family [Nonomuraea solani]